MNQPRQARFDQAASNYGAAATWQDLSFDYLCQYLPGELDSFIDLGCGSGQHLAFLASRYPKSSCIAVDSSQAMLREVQKKKIKHCRWIQANFDDAECFEELPMVSLVVANASLHWSQDIPLLLKRIRACLKKQGRFIASFFLPETFQELQSLFNEKDFIPAANFQDLGTLKKVISSYFTIEDSKKINLKQIYPSLKHLLRHIKQTGVHEKKSQGLWTPRRLAELETYYLQHYGSITASAAFWVVCASA